MSKIPVLAVVACCIAVAPSAFAQRYLPSSGDEAGHRHEGLFMRFDVGGGYLKTSGNISGSDATISGPAGSFGFSFGANVVPNLALFGHVALSAVSNPSVTYGASSGTTSDASISFAAVGGGASWYVMPSNLYVSGTLLMTRLTTTVNGNSGSTNAGFGARLAIGKEWWVSESWGLGVAGQFMFGSNVDQGANAPTWMTITPSLAFSASYN